MQVQQHHPALLHVQNQLAGALADEQDARAALAASQVCPGRQHWGFMGVWVYF
jgi:hypothetical protein